MNQIGKDLCALILSLIAFCSPPCFAGLVEDVQKADQELNGAYDRVRGDLNSDSMKKLKKAQLAWISYRDKMCDFESLGLLTSSQPLVTSLMTETDRANCVLRLTRIRTRELELYRAIISGGEPKSRLLGDVLATVNKTSQLHVVGVYEGTNPVEAMVPRGAMLVKIAPGSDGGRQAVNGKIDLHLIQNFEADSVVLVLLSHDPVDWEIHNPDQVLIEKIYLNNSGSDVKGVKDVSILRESNNDLTMIYDRDNLGRLEAQIKALTGLAVKTFQGSYKGERFDIR